MSTAVDDDAAAFVAARWPDLESVALVASLDRERARDLTVRALSGLLGRWPDPAGAPTLAARRSLLDLVDELPTDAPVDPALWGAVRDDDSGLPLALLEALAAEPPARRARIAAEIRWDPGSVGNPSGAARPDDQAAHERLIAAHRRARLDDGLSPADDRLRDDLADLVDRLAATVPDPPDPTALVALRAQREAAARVRRRSALLGGGALVATGAAWVAFDRAVTGTPGPTSAPTGPSSAADWSTTARWPARGSLAADPVVRARLIRTRAPARLLYAGDIHGVRVAVAARVDVAPGSTRLLVLTGPSGSWPEELSETPYALDTVLGRTDLAVLGVPRRTGAVLLVLARPEVAGAQVSTHVRPTPAGEIERTWRSLRLENGVGSLLLERPWGAAVEVTVDGDRTPVVPSPSAWQAFPSGGDDPVDAALRTTASATGAQRSTLTAELLVSGPVHGSALDPPEAGTATLSLTRVATADGAVVRSLDVRRDDPNGVPTVLAAGALVVPAADADAPVVLRVRDAGPRIGQYLVAAPTGGATCQLLATSPNAYPVSKVEPLESGVGVVPVINADSASSFRLVVRDRDGGLRYDGVPPAGRDLLGRASDDGRAGGAATGTGWLGLPLPYPS